MVTAVTQGIHVSVQVTYQAEFSNPHQHHFVFTYKVTIENKSQHTYQLLSRKWQVYDAAEEVKVIAGDGVVGKQPILEPGESHSYVSGCNLISGMGKMTGIYTMEKLFDGKRIEVQIPEIQLMANYLQN